MPGRTAAPRPLDVPIRSVAVAACVSDEETLALAATAAGRALHAAGMAPHRVEGLWWGTTREPFASGPGWTTLAAALRLGTATDGAMSTGSPHAGVDALLAATDAVASGRVTTALVCTSDAAGPELGSGHERATGAGAAAVVLQRGDGPARFDSVVSRWLPVLERYRGDDRLEVPDPYDGRLFRDEVYLPLGGEVIEALGAHAGARWSIADPDGRMAAALTHRMHLDPPVSAGLRNELGDLGAGAPLAGIAAALSEPGPAALLAVGGGRCTAIAIAVDAPVPGAARVANWLAEDVEGS